MTSIFISHSSKDNTLVREIYERLRARGYETLFLDFDPEVGLPAGTKWELELRRELARSRAVLFVCTRNWLVSQWCFAEAVHAELEGKELFPLELEDGAVPQILQDRQIIRLCDGEEAGYERLWSGLTRAGLDPQGDFVWKSSDPPYPGFLPFDVDDAAVFYGRETEIRETLDLFNILWDRRLEATQPRLIVVMGPSGSGKSSLARAGIFPRLRKRPDRWLPLKPVEAQAGRLPGLEASFDEILAAVKSKPRVRRTVRMFRDALLGGRNASTISERAGAAEPTVSSNAPVPVQLIDQFEQLLTVAPAPEQASALRRLRDALDSSRPTSVVLATLRSDYLEAFQQSADLQGVSFAPILLPAMSRDALGEAIARPVERVGLTMAPALVDRLKNASLTRNRFLSWRSCCAIYRRLITIGLGSVTGQREEVVLWDLAGRKPLGDVIARQPAGITSVAFSPDGTLLAAGSEDHTVLLWDVVNRKHLCEPLAAHSGAVSSVAFSPDGRLLATGSQDKTILIWDMISRARARVPLDAHQDAIHTVAFSPDGQVLASGSEDQTIILWDVLNSRPLSAPLADHRFPVRSVAFTPDGQYLAAATSMPQLAPHSQRVALKPIARENSTAFPPGSSSGP